MGHADEGEAHSKRALELDPFNALYLGLYAIVLDYLRRYDDAIAVARTALTIQPNIGPALNALEDSLFLKGAQAEHLDFQRTRIAQDPARVAWFDRSLAEGGYRGVQLAIANDRAARYRKSGSMVPAIGVASSCIKAGEYDQALDWLEKSYEDHDPNLLYLGLPRYDPVRSDPRFQTLLRRIGLPTD
jgi:tetratricopeptide (TPR) repeat protein